MHLKEPSMYTSENTFEFLHRPSIYTKNADPDPEPNLNPNPNSNPKLSLHKIEGPP